MADVPDFDFAPDPRCGRYVTEPRPGFCGARAVSAIVGANGIALEFRCAEHPAENARPIPQTYLVRRVTVSVQVQLAAVQFGRGEAEMEAAGRVVEACQGIGGLVNLVDHHSVVGRYTAPAALPDKRRPRGRP